jgi:exopolyphosphatase/pppGpp-phosphohydrolase
LAPVYALAEDCLYEVGHAHHVARLALLMFDQLQPLHQLGPKRRFRLTAAALLHDIGHLEGSRGHHKTSLRYILDSPLLPWSQRQRLVVGSIARYHRKVLPSARHDHFVALSATDRRDVCVLGGLLRLADALDTSHRSIVRDVNCRFDDRRVMVGCTVRREARNAAEWGRAVRKADLLVEALDRDVCIEWRPL